MRHETDYLQKELKVGNTSTMLQTQVLVDYQNKEVHLPGNV